MLVRTNFIYSILILSVISFCSLVLIVASDDESVYNDKDDALWAYNDFKNDKDSHFLAWVQLIVLDAHKRALTVSFNSNKSTMEKEALELAIDAIPTGWDLGDNIKDTAKNAAKIAITYSDDLALKKALVSKTLEIQKQKVTVATKLKQLDDAYEHYLDHVDAYNETTRYKKTPNPKGDIPSDEIGVDTNLSVPCSNPKCDTVYTVGDEHPDGSDTHITLDNVVGLSEGHHLYTCTKQWSVQVLKGKYELYKKHPERFPSGQCSESYWVCPNDVNECSKEVNHLLPCGGGCGDLFPRYSFQNNAVDFSHRTKCTEQIPESYVKTFGKSDKYVDCIGWYYNCNGQTSSDCGYAKAHKVDDDDEEEASSTPQTPTPTPQTPTTPTATTDSTSYKAGSTVTVTVSSSEAIYGAYLYVSGNLIGWFGGSTTTSSLSLTYKFPDSATVGSYTISVSVYDWNENQNSWGDSTSIDNTVSIVE